MENEFYVGWGTLALINAALIQNKNHHPLPCLLVSLFLGPLVTLMILFIKKKQED